MTDQPAPALAQQVTPGQQAPGTSGTAAPEGYIEIARYNGLVRKVEELTLSNRDLNAQLAVKTSEIEQLKGQLSIKDTEKTVAVGERDTRLTAALQENATLQSQIKELKGLQLKVKVAKDLNRPELLKIADRIPAIEDEEALKVVMQDFASFADELVKEREKVLLAGVTLPAGPGSVAPAAPTTSEAWLKKINGFDFGTPERRKAMDEYGDWLEKTNRPQ